jgi:hypothetical protein
VEARDIEIDHNPAARLVQGGRRGRGPRARPVPDQETVTCVIPGHHRQGRELFGDSIDVNAGRWCCRPRDDAPTRQHSSTHPTIDNETRAHSRPSGMSPGPVPVSAERAGPRSLGSACIDGGGPAKRRRAGARSSAKCFGEIGGWRAWDRTPAVGRTFRATTAECRHRPPRARSALMPGCAARGWRSQTSTRPTLLRSRPNTRRPKARVRVR